MSCVHNHEGFCIFNGTIPCELAEGDLLVCAAEEEDLVEGYEECEFCGGPGTFTTDDSPCPAPFPEETCWRLSIDKHKKRLE